jgi:carbamoyltransferase
MGLAPYGKADYCLDEMRSLIRIHPTRPLEFQNTSGECGTRVQKVLRKRLAGQRFDNIAAACQAYFEQLMVQWIRNAVQATGLRKVACAGGLFLNVKANKRLAELDEVEDIFFYPACDDGGTPVGAALEAYYRFCERDGTKPVRESLGPIYYGMEYSEEEIVTALKARGWQDKAERMGDMDGHLGELVAKGKIVARFQGGVEWGPRALGNRSILADPRDLRVVKRLNSAIKQRDFWMPFAPSILEERMDEYLVDAHPARYMVEAFDTTERAAELGAALHPQDATARPQTVNSWNPGYRGALETFEAETSVGGVLNTSFNLHGYPIAGTPEMALWTFENSQLDALALGDYLVTK